MDVFNFGKVIQDLENRTWGNLDELYEEHNEGYNRMQSNYDVRNSTGQGNMKKTYNEVIVTPKLRLCLNPFGDIVVKYLFFLWLN